MTHGELFAGVSGFGLGFERAGTNTLWHVEIDPTCQQVLRNHYPDALLLDDVRKCGAHNLPPVDIITFGSPCQDLSVAGKRRGLEGDRSGLFYEAIRIIRELRPTYAVWENVPGALNSNEGRDFGAALDALAESGALDIGWAVLDSQWFGVPQRRRRVFVVADFRGQRAAEILSIPYGSPRDTPPSREAGAGIATGLTAGTAASSGVNRPGRRREDDVNLAFESRYARNGRGAPSGIVPPLKAQSGQSGKGDAAPLVYQCHGNNIGEMGTLRQGNGGLTGGVPFVTHTLRSEGADASEDGTGRGVPLVAFGKAVKTTLHQGDRVIGDGDQWPTLPAQNANNGGGGGALLLNAMAVRRLTPTECCRLQGFPDDWLGGLSDSAKYRCLGNAVTVSVAQWLAERILQVEATL